ncbi:MAG: helix-turn-helix protein [Rickettsiaceae bacterium]|nr:helix-turn-helix protein [Rickettsiaceae bacterium]
MSDIDQIRIGEWVDREERAIASKLFKIRTKLGIDRDELATMAGIGISELVEYESGVQPIPASTLAIIAAMMGVSLDYFYSYNLDAENEDSAILGSTLPAVKKEKAALLCN